MSVVYFIRGTLPKLGSEKRNTRADQPARDGPRERRLPEDLGAEGVPGLREDLRGARRPEADGVDGVAGFGGGVDVGWGGERMG